MTPAMDSVILQLEANKTMAAAATILASFLFSLYYLYRKPKSMLQPPPEAEGAWPLIGHLHLLGGAQPPHITLGNMADKYGPIFTLKLGAHRSLIISNSELAKECLTTHDKAFANRPTALALEVLGYNYTVLGFCRYGPKWRALRKVSVRELFSNHRLHMIRSVRASEVNASIRDIHDACREAGPDDGVAMEMSRWFGDMTLNVIFRIMIGRRFVAVDEAGEMCRRAFREYLDLSGKFVVSDALPYLRWLDIGGSEKAMRKTLKDLDGVLQLWLDEHKEKRSSSSSVSKDDHHHVNDGEDFMGAMLSIIQDGVHEELSGYDGDTLIKATCLSLILAASDTTSLTMTWTLSLLLNNPHILKKAQQELDNVVGKRQLEETDMKSLMYLEAIVKESMRLCTVVPLLLPHESMEDRTVGGYHVPAGTRITFNAWKIHHDPLKWPNPFEFNPERFLSTHGDVDAGGKHFELIPFSSGRRMCPGTNFALEVIHFALATLLHDFDVYNPSAEPIDMQEGSGLTNVKASPLEVLLKPRLATD